MAIAKNTRLDNASSFPAGVPLMADKPMLIPATHNETFIHFRKVLSLAKNNFGSTFLAPSSSKVVGCLLPAKRASNLLERGFGWMVSGGFGMLVSDVGCFISDTALT